jgi:hypothetical protein
MSRNAPKRAIPVVYTTARFASSVNEDGGSTRHGMAQGAAPSAGSGRRDAYRLVVKLHIWDQGLPSTLAAILTV